ncbi:MAG: HD domain-containing protein [Bacteroidota bacterium]
MHTTFRTILEVLSLAEKLKFELRHSWLSNGRQESVAEHTWRMSLMALLLEPYLDQPVDMLRLLKMIIIHDLVEAEAGDIPVFHTLNSEEVRQQKSMNEQRAIEHIREQLGEPTGPEFYDLWQEFEHKKSYEAKVANAIDKLEVQIQHNEADFSTWLDIENELVYTMDPHVAFDKNLKVFKEIIVEDAELKMKNGGVQLETLKAKISN